MPETLVRGPAIRRPVVAGYFYPAEPERLRQAIDAACKPAEPTRQARAVIAPHDSYQRCGAVLGATFSPLRIPHRCVILGPSHTGSWMRWSLMASGAYRTPLGEVPVDEEAAAWLRARCPFLEPDARHQRGEHAIEVLVPFLQRLGPADLTIVPVIMGPEDRDEIDRLARALAELAAAPAGGALLIASAECSQYATRTQAEAQDRELLEAVSALDARRVLALAGEAGNRLCGAGAVACVLEAARASGAGRGALVRYGTSADAGGDPHSVSGYAGVIIQ
jgi:AmmeMemoRadiSam system protein B